MHAAAQPRQTAGNGGLPRRVGADVAAVPAVAAVWAAVAVPSPRLSVVAVAAVAAAATLRLHAACQEDV